MCATTNNATGAFTGTKYKFQKPNMKCCTILLFCIFLFQFLRAHPGVGIVIDRRGTVYYTDLKHIWKIDTDGKKTIAVANVHSHELYIDSADNLFGEHLWYNGEEKDTWGHYVWCLKSDGSLVNIKEASPGFLQDYSFVRDSRGNMYWSERWKRSRIKKKTPGGNITVIAEGQYPGISWLHATANGAVYFVDQQGLNKIHPDGKVSQVLKRTDLSRRLRVDPTVTPQFFGVWTDRLENIYIAIKGEDVVKKITPTGTVSIFASSSNGWFPTGGVFDQSNNLWLLEYNLSNEARARKIVSNNASHPNR
jgi:hypothetical protein